MNIIKNNIKNSINNIKKKSAEEERKKTLEKILHEEKITNTKQSLCKSYIKFENPSLDELMRLIKKEQHDKETRLLKLMEILKQNKMEYDEKIPVFENYIKCGGNLKTIIEEGKLEKTLIYNTKYESYLKYNSIAISRYLAVTEFINSGKKCDEVKKFVSRNTTLNFL